MRRWLTGVVAVGLVAVLSVGAAVWLPSRAPVAAAADPTEGAAKEPGRYITVVGQGTVQVSPDIAVLTVGAESIDAEVQAAVKASNAIMEDIGAALTEAGIDEADIQTSNFSVYTDQGYGQEGEATEPRYHVSQMVTVKIRDLESVGQVLDAVVEAGANTIYGVNFTLEDWSAAQADARAKAVADAADRASQLAKLADVELSDVISVSEVIGASTYSPVAMAPAVSYGGGGGTSVSPGQLDVSMSVQVTYAVQ